MKPGKQGQLVKVVKGPGTGQTGYVQWVSIENCEVAFSPSKEGKMILLWDYLEPVE